MENKLIVLPGLHGSEIPRLQPEQIRKSVKWLFDNNKEKFQTSSRKVVLQ